MRTYLYEDPDSVVRSYLRDGADGWRLDTAYELGPDYLRDLTRAAHLEKADSLIVGEIVNYPGEWLESIDAVMNFSLRHILLGLASGAIAPSSAGRMLDRLVREAGIEPLLKSWMVIDNHDIPRIASQIPRDSLRRLVQVLQFTLPGAPNIYYGSEVGMTGGSDPENRGPMRWDLVRDDNPELDLDQETDRVTERTPGAARWKLPARRVRSPVGLRTLYRSGAGDNRRAGQSVWCNYYGTSADCQSVSDGRHTHGRPPCSSRVRHL